MGKIYQGILGGVSKKVGSVVGASWKGIPVIRSYQPNVSNPKTAAQEEQRGWFKDIVLVAEDLLANVIKPLWDRFAVKMSGYNAFISANKVSKSSTGELVMSDIIFCKGKMSATEITEVLLGGNTVEISFPSTLGGRYQLGTDIPYVFAYDETQKKVYGVAALIGTRSTGQANIAISSMGFTPSAATTYFRIGFKRADGTVVSDQSAAVLPTA